MSSARLLRFVRNPALRPARSCVAALLSGAVFTAMVLAGAVVTAATPARADCTCRARGQDFALGTTICLPAGLMRCEMASNVTSWTPLGRACPESRMSVPFLVAAADPDDDDGHEAEDRAKLGIDTR
jgi:hypothetical protein